MGERKVLEKQSILFHPQPPSSSCSLFHVSSARLRFSSPGALLLHLNFLLCFHHLLTHPSTPPPHTSPYYAPFFSALHHTLITSSIAKNQMSRPAAHSLLKSTHNGAQGYLKLSVKTASRSFTPPHRIVMDVLSDCSIWLPYLKRGSISHRSPSR